MSNVFFLNSRSQKSLIFRATEVCTPPGKSFVLKFIPDLLIFQKTK